MAGRTWNGSKKKRRFLDSKWQWFFRYRHDRIIFGSVRVNVRLVSDKERLVTRNLSSVGLGTRVSSLSLDLNRDSDRRLSPNSASSDPGHDTSRALVKVKSLLSDLQPLEPRIRTTTPFPTLWLSIRYRSSPVERILAEGRNAVIVHFVRGNGRKFQRVFLLVTCTKRRYLYYLDALGDPKICISV